MLHQTLVSFQPFSSSSSSPYPLPSPSASAGSSSSTFLLSAGRLLSSPPPYPRSSQVNMKLMKETLSSARDQGFLGDEVDDVAWAAERGNLLGEDFQVDDLLDLRGLPEYDEDEEAPRAPEATFSPPKSLPCAENEPLELYSEITLHETDAASLEWLSRFFDDCSKECTSPPPSPSYFDMPLSLPTQNNPPWKYSSAGSRGEPTPSLSSTATAAGSLSTEGLVPIKAKRSKRLRGSGTVWSRSGSLRLADSSSPASSITTFTAASASASASSSPSPSSSSSSSSFNSYISYEAPPFAGFLLDDSSLAPPKAQRPKKRGRKPKNPFISPAERRCTHCGVHKTPQWRAGPHGAKTLCNACGVRFKSGRLLPEYRPACSPTFVSNIHSNSHRKVLEMRRKKDEQVIVTSAPPVTSC